ncbi:MAG: sigma-70 family RNA polymerase sigma factor [Pseudomonadota bacterium]
MRESSPENRIADYVVMNRESIYRLAYSYVKNTEDALDIVQESIYKAISSKASLKEPEYIRTWFYRIVVNTSLDLLRKQKRLVVVDDEAMASLDTGMSDDYRDFDLHRALDDLPDNYRSIIVLRYFEDLKIEEVAEILNENISTVKTRLYKSLQKLRMEMKK